MNRLTKRNEDGSVYLPRCFEKCDGAPMDCLGCEEDIAITDRLAAYEDTGLEPEEAEACKVALMGKSIAEIKEIEALPLGRLKEIAKADVEGRLIVLPCRDNATLEYNGLYYKGNHWNPPVLTAFADDPTVPGGRRICLFKMYEVEEAVRKEAAGERAVGDTGRTGDHLIRRGETATPSPQGEGFETEDAGRDGGDAGLYGGADDGRD